MNFVEGWNFWMMARSLWRSLGLRIWTIRTDLSQGMSLYVSTHRTTKTLTRYQVLLGWREGIGLPRLDIKPVLDDVVKVQVSTQISGSRASALSSHYVIWLVDAVFATVLHKAPENSLLWINEATWYCSITTEPWSPKLNLTNWCSTPFRHLVLCYDA